MSQPLLLYLSVLHYARYPQAPISIHQVCLQWCLIYPLNICLLFKILFINFRERGKEVEREKHRSAAPLIHILSLVDSCMYPTRDRTHKFGVSGRPSNQWDTQWGLPTEHLISMKNVFTSSSSTGFFVKSTWSFWIVSYSCLMFSITSLCLQYCELIYLQYLTNSSIIISSWGGGV